MRPPALAEFLLRPFDLAGSLVLEGAEVGAKGREVVASSPDLFLGIALLSIATQFSSFVCLKRVSALTMKIVVCVRRAAGREHLARGPHQSTASWT